MENQESQGSQEQTKAVVKYGMGRQIQVSEDQKKLVKSVIFPDSTDDELKLYLYECERRGVHPLDRKIFPIKRSIGDTGEKRVTFQTSIDFMRSESEETGLYAGIDAPEYGPEVDKYPEWAKVVIYKWIMAPDGQYQRVPFAGIARWKEYYPGEKLGFMWRKMPHHMLAKCSEAIARRLAFPQRLEKLYLPEEFEGVSAVGAGSGQSLTDTVVEVEVVRGDDVAKEPPPSKAPTGPRRIGQEKPGKSATVNDTLKAEIDGLTDDMHERQRILRAVSSYTDEAGKERYIEYDKLNKASNRWAGKALNNLKKMLAAGKDGQPEGCTNDPRTCDYSAWVREGEALSADCTGKPVVKRCPHDAQGQA